MCVKKVVLVFVALAAILSGRAMGDIFWNDDDPCDHLWLSPDNWTLDRVPIAGEAAFIRDVAVDNLERSPVVEEGAVIPETGTLTYLVINEGQAGTSYLTVTGGTITTQQLLIGWDAAQSGEYNRGGKLIISGGTINISGPFYVGLWGGCGTIEMTGGTINHTGGTVLLPALDNKGKGCPSAVYVHGGTFKTGGLGFGGAYGTLDITEGTVVLAGDQVDTVNANVAAGRITGYSGRAGVVADYNSVSDETTVTAEAPNMAVAWNPYPANGQAEVGLDVVLTWVPGDYADSHDVYFGTDFDEVSSALDPMTPPGRGNYDVNSYAPASLELGETYYWRIDEVNDANDDSPWKGSVWSFTVADYVVLDDFESYADDDALTEVWDDWWVNDSGAEISLESEPAPVLGTHSMLYNYNNWYGPYSEADIVFDSPHDWSTVKALGLSFHGSPDNDIEQIQMYVAVEDEDGERAEVAYAGDPNDLISRPWLISDWHTWNIDMRSFNGGSIDLTKVAKFTIGFSGENIIGNVYFDNIRLYASRCMPEYGPAGDVTGDCAVDWQDAAVMAADWLASGLTITTTEPNAEALVALYTFDDGTAADTSGFGTAADGELIDDAEIIDDAERGKVLSLSGGFVDCGADSKFDLTEQMTGSCWVKANRYVQEWQTIFGRGDGDWLVASGPGNTTLLAAWWKPTGEVIAFGGTKDLYDNQWHHVALVYDGAAGYLYVDGVVDAQVAATGPMLMEYFNFMIGTNANPGVQHRVWGGLIDDVRIYNYGLSQAEIAYLAADGADELQLPLQQTAADVYEDQSINFRDFAVMAADNWLKGPVLWP